MPSGQILYLMMFVGKCSLRAKRPRSSACTSHVLQYSSSRSYEHSRSLQSILCPGVVTVLICSFFVAALLLIYINLKNGGKIIHIFTNCQTFSYLFCIFSQKFAIFATTTLSASSIFTTFVRLYTPLLYGMYMQIAVAQISLLTQVPIYPS